MHLTLAVLFGPKETSHVFFVFESGVMRNVVAGHSKSVVRSFLCNRFGPFLRNLFRLDLSGFFGVCVLTA